MQARWPWVLHGMDDEGGGPISGTSSKASGADGLPDTSCISSPTPWKLPTSPRRSPPLAVLHKLEVAGCHKDRSPPLRGLSRRGRTPPPSLGASACEELLPTNPNIQGAALFWRRLEGRLLAKIDSLAGGLRASRSRGFNRRQAGGGAIKPRPTPPAPHARRPGSRCLHPHRFHSATR